MRLEYDINKSISNRKKHGIDFEEAKSLWGDPDLLEIPARTIDEPRPLVIGIIGRKHWSAIITKRGIKTRIISVRRSHKSEVNLYESEDIG
jgi:hypothetical protein